MPTRQPIRPAGDVDVYAHVTAQMKTESAKRMQDYISSIMERQIALKKISPHKAKNKAKSAAKNPATVEVAGFFMVHRGNPNPNRKRRRAG